ncbi:cyclic nucleotide-binding domain-containing protein [Colwellia sp. 1_MG-2023]|jgi:CRP-like cAMP-binding protein|uniref:cyclic nucleotide-binding domain-containing protein n=1 Tax=unclassified Colwellia TaxID=196834 RepID=UPI001C090DD5|nr:MULTISPECIES: cyclic nucleotide-binding domain-containing protein [unclassified Colwellia]MBU2926173.1 cyclic nucleotide-binding domain-containing protein [Colwellia sp. C2M11]MDO6507139.1 cyclic nucleotide-binding domain-containing protein [Colwellia sp. 5_MG-2023]MDO6652406.1 cyclic nucleotide-binding domain-containing protein [Colwellia sp. 3_MG-2023]MDO6665719.1 cyclic nucleotide-binding domain-containing protein [Colwellia sp. 2_MG-2023]MDO6690092.1 cyclic nucleotide-binding domain-con
MLPLKNISRLKLLEIVARINFFKRLTLQERELLLNSSACYKCYKDKFVQTEDDHNSNFYIVLSGKIAITKNNTDNIVGYISVGEFIGESSFINKSRKSASAKAVDDSIILCIDQDALRDLPLKIKDKCKDAIIEGMASRIAYLTENIQQLP